MISSMASTPKGRTMSDATEVRSRALLPRLGSSKRPNHSSTARLEVMTKLELRWRPMMSP